MCDAKGTMYTHLYLVLFIFSFVPFEFCSILRRGGEGKILLYAQKPSTPRLTINVILTASFQIYQSFNSIAMSSAHDLWGDEDDDDLVALAEQSELSFSIEQNLDSTNEEDLLVETIATKDKADEDSYDALGLVPPTKEQENFLRNTFGPPKFKPLQWRIIRSVMVERKDQCVVMSTGYGKSLCY